MDYILRILPNMFAGLGVSAQIFLITIVLFAADRVSCWHWFAFSKSLFSASFTEIYIYVMRGTPLMLQILFIYYGLPFIIDGLKLPAFPAAIIAFVLNYAAYFAEIFRGGIQSIDRGQYEGAKSWA